MWALIGRIRAIWGLATRGEKEKMGKKGSRRGGARAEIRPEPAQSGIRFSSPLIRFNPGGPPRVWHEEATTGKLPTLSIALGQACPILWSGQGVVNASRRCRGVAARFNDCLSPCSEDDDSGRLDSLALMLAARREGARPPTHTPRSTTDGLLPLLCCICPFSKWRLVVSGGESTRLEQEAAVGAHKLVRGGGLHEMTMMQMRCARWGQWNRSLTPRASPAPPTHTDTGPATTCRTVARRTGRAPRRRRTTDSIDTPSA